MRVNLTVTDDALVVSGLPGPRDEPPDLPDAGTIDLGDGVTVRATDAGFEVAGLPAPTATDAGA